MGIYITMVLVSTLSAWQATNPELKNGVKLSDGIKKLLMIISFLSLFIVAAFRLNVGTDYNSYVQMYEHPEWFIKNYLLLDILLEGLRKITSNSQIFFIISSFLIYGAFFKATYKESSLPAYSIYLFVAMEDYFVSMNIVRQYMAIAFVWVAISCLVEGKYVKYAVFILIGAAFHPSVLLAIVFIPLFIWRPSLKKIIFSATVASGIMWMCYPMVISLVIKFTEYGRYFESLYANRQYAVAIPMLLINIVIFLVILFLSNRDKLKQDNRLCVFYYSTIINIVIMIISFRLTANTYRLSYIFSGLQAIYFPVMLESIDNKKSRLVVKWCSVGLFSIWTVMLITHNNQNVLPYQFCF